MRMIQWEQQQQRDQGHHQVHQQERDYGHHERHKPDHRRDHRRDYGSHKRPRENEHNEDEIARRKRSRADSSETSRE